MIEGDMGIIRNLGRGYYGIEAEGVSIDREVTARFEKAFRDAQKIPDEKLKVRFYRPSGSPARPPRSKSSGRGK
jgi:hypothetical protein